MQPGDYAGLTRKFKVNRRLTEQEREQRLRQEDRLDVDPTDQLSVIKLNSTYLETVDRYYVVKGWLTMWMGVAVIVTLMILALVLLPVFDRPSEFSDWWFLPVLGVPACAAMFGVAWWLFSKEARQYTHYPIRVNRKSRMAYVFRQDGSILSANWDRLFFTLGKEAGIYGVPLYDIRGHVLANDGETVTETFTFAAVESAEIVTRHWELLRRYMENGPQEAHAQVRYCMPVDGRKETFRQGLWRLMEAEWFLKYLLFPLVLIVACCRWLAMRMGQLPLWPEWVEAECAIAADDPYIKAAGNNPSDYPGRGALGDSIAHARQQPADTTEA